MKNTRRAFFASAMAAIPAAAATAAGVKFDNNPAFRTCARASGGPNANRFPQIIVQDQHGKKGWLYDDLLKDKLTLVSFTSVKGEQYYPILNNLVKVQEMLGDRLGKQVFMYTITTNPYDDTPEDLKALAEQHGANWQFLTGKAEDVREALTAFHARGSLFGVTWIGNEQTGRWLTKPSQLHPLYIAEAVARLSTGKDHKPFLIDMHSA